MFNEMKKIIEKRGEPKVGVMADILQSGETNPKYIEIAIGRDVVDYAKNDDILFGGHRPKGGDSFPLKIRASQFAAKDDLNTPMTDVDGHWANVMLRLHPDGNADVTLVTILKTDGEIYNRGKGDLDEACIPIDSKEIAKFKKELNEAEKNLNKTGRYQYIPGNFVKLITTTIMKRLEELENKKSH